MKSLKIAFSILWVVLLVIAVVSWLRSDVALAEVPQLLHDLLAEFGVLKAATVYVVLYTVRPLVLFPATVLTVASGLIFGPVLGVAFTILGENASANFAFVLARWLGRSWVSEHEGDFVKRWDDRIRENALTSVLIMRLIYLPFDAVSYGCGLTSMRQRDYFLGTFLGILPGLVSFVLLGGSAAAGVQGRGWVFGSAVFFFFVGLVIARALRRVSPEADIEEPEPARGVGS